MPAKRVPRGKAHRATDVERPAKKEAHGAARSPSAARQGDGRRGFWLLKTEPGTFSYADLEGAPGRSTAWDGVRNFLARNYMRDQMRRGDLILIYHSGIDEPAIAGIAEVVREAYPDETAFDSTHAHYDPKSDRTAPTWVMIDVRAVTALARPLTLAELREVRGLESMVLLQRGSRLSVQPVSEGEWEIVTRLGGVR